MNTLITHPQNLIFTVIGCFLSLILGFFLLFNKKNKANPFLGVLIFVISTYFFTAFFDRFSLLVHLPHIIGISTVTPFLIGPLSYLYVSACTQKEFQMHRLTWLHFLPFILDVLLFTPFFLKSGTEKVDLFECFVKTGDLEQPHFLLILKAVHSITYIALAIRLIVQYRKHLNNASSTIDLAFHRWMLVFLILMTLPIFGQIGFVFLDFQRVLITIGLASFFSFLLVVFIATLVKPEVFQAFPHLMTAVDLEEDEQKEKYEGSKLDPSQKENYLKKLIVYMESEKPYHEPELTILELSNQVKIPVNHLSQLINEKLGVHFIDFINGYRIKETKEKLADPKLIHFTILSIAYDVGFNAKSTFYAVFKKQTGQTPSEYRKLMASTRSKES